MNCRRAREALAENWGTGRSLDATVRSHVDGCAACAGAAGDLARILDHVSGMGTPDPGPAYWDRFAARVRERAGREAPSSPPQAASDPVRPSGGRALRWWAAASAAAAILVAALVWTGWNPPAAPSAGPDIATLRSRLDAELLTGGAEARSAAEDLLPAGEGDAENEEVGGGWAGAPPVLDEEAAEEALGNVTTILSPLPLAGLPDAFGMVEELSAAQIEKLLREMGPVETHGAVRSLEVRSG